MKIVLATIQTPFINGGAEYLIGGLHFALSEAGNKVERVSMPFRFSPVKEVQRSLKIWQGEDLTTLNGHCPDLVVCMQFPTYHVRHPRKILWLMHQFRIVYDLWDTPYAPDEARRVEGKELQEEIISSDTESLRDIERRYTISKTVSSRLRHYNSITSEPLYHPPFMAERFYSAEAEGYVLVPSRLEGTKRQDLFIRAMTHVKCNVIGVICGEGGQRNNLARLCAELSLEDRIKFVGQVTEEEKQGLYAHALCIFFGPYDEDYGYVTLEAMLSSKPVITCTDSGGPLEFIIPEQTGWVVPPRAEEIARAIDFLAQNPARAKQAGKAARAHYDEMDISWQTVIENLLQRYQA